MPGDIFVFLLKYICRFSAELLHVCYYFFVFPFFVTFCRLKKGSPEELLIYFLSLYLFFSF